MTDCIGKGSKTALQIWSFLAKKVKELKELHYILLPVSRNCNGSSKSLTSGEKSSTSMPTFSGSGWPHKASLARIG